VATKHETFDLKSARREVKALKNLRHPHIVNFIEEIDTDSEYVIILSLARGGDLLQRLNRQTFNEADLRRLFFNLCETIAWMHSRGWTHRDLKPENVLLDEDDVVLTDFGFATKAEPGEQVKDLSGTMGYCAPQVVRGEPYSPFAADAWSLGTILYACLFGHLPFDAPQHIEGKLVAYKPVTAECEELLLGLLEEDEDRRWTVDRALNSVWLASCKPVTNSPRKKRSSIKRLMENFQSLLSRNSTGSAIA